LSVSNAQASFRQVISIASAPGSGTKPHAIQFTMHTSKLTQYFSQFYFAQSKRSTRKSQIFISQTYNHLQQDWGLQN